MAHAQLHNPSSARASLLSWTILLEHKTWNTMQSQRLQEHKTYKDKGHNADGWHNTRLGFPHGLAACMSIPSTLDPDFWTNCCGVSLTMATGSQPQAFVASRFRQTIELRLLTEGMEL